MTTRLWPLGLVFALVPAAASWCQTPLPANEPFTATLKIESKATPPERIAVLEAKLDADEELKGWSLEATGVAKKRMPAPKIAKTDNGPMLNLLESWSNSTAAAAAPAPAATLAREVHIAFTLVMNTGTEGMGFAWLDMAKHGNNPAVPQPLTPEQVPTPGGNAMITQAPWGWEAPNFLSGFGVGFDASDPPNRDPFGGSGNIYDRPQHEISLHWDGREIVKKATTTEFRDEKRHDVKLTLAFETGGCRVSVMLDAEPVFANVFIPGMTAFAGRPVWGARNNETAGDVLIDDVKMELFDSIPQPPAEPLRVEVFSRVLNDAGHGENSREVELPSDASRYGRVVAVLRLDKPETKFDPWDRSAHIFIETPASGDKPAERFELLRYMTPYHRGWEWSMDVTDFRPLLTGTRRIIQTCGTQGEGWVVSLRLDYYEGPPPLGLSPREVRNLWSGSPEIGNPDKPASGFYTTIETPFPAWAVCAKVRMTVTGHGMSPNTNNAAEFMPIGRTLTINGLTQSNRLWKEDNYLNPCRPQGGTWKYDRAGWGPGDIVRPWEFLVGFTPETRPETLSISYALDPYVNTDRGKTWAPFHLTHSVVVLYEVVK